MKSYSTITPYISEMAALSDKNNGIVSEMYAKHKVNRGLRDMSGNGVVTGLTEISNIKAKEKNEKGETVPCDGELSYRGINVRDFLIKTALTGTNRAYAFQQLTEVIFSEERLSLLQTFIIHDKSLAHIFR